MLLLAAGGGLYATGILGKVLGHGGAAENNANGSDAAGKADGPRSQRVDAGRHAGTVALERRRA